MTVTSEFKEASTRAAIRALRGLEPTAKMLEQYAAETFPPNDHGQVHFGRALMDAAAEAIRGAWRQAIREVEAFPADDNGIVEQLGKLRRALGKIVDLEASEADDPLDDAISIARMALGEKEGRS